MRLALVQFPAGPDTLDNATRACEEVRKAAAQGASVVVFPEATSQAFDSGPLSASAEPLCEEVIHRPDGSAVSPQGEESASPFSTALREVALELGVTVVAGMFRPADAGRVFNTVLVTGPKVHLGYDKIHLFDTATYRESDTVAPGSQLVMFQVGEVNVGVATCFDIRFPDHFIKLAQRDASIVLVPTSWADGPGKRDQWRVLTRARALDAGVFIIAVDQPRPGGEAMAGRKSGPTGIGHSVVVAPDGRVVAESGWEPELLIVDIDPTEAATRRKNLPLF